MSAANALPASFGPWSRRARAFAAALSHELEWVEQKAPLNTRLRHAYAAALRDSQAQLFAFKTPLDDIVFPAYLSRADLQQLRGDCSTTALTKCLTDRGAFDKHLASWFESQLKKDARVSLYL